MLPTWLLGSLGTAIDRTRPIDIPEISCKLGKYNDPPPSSNARRRMDDGEATRQHAARSTPRSAHAFDARR